MGSGEGSVNSTLRCYKDLCQSMLKVSILEQAFAGRTMNFVIRIGSSSENSSFSLTKLVKYFNKEKRFKCFSNKYNLFPYINKQELLK